MLLLALSTPILAEENPIIDYPAAYLESGDRAEFNGYLISPDSVIELISRIEVCEGLLIANDGQLEASQRACDKHIEELRQAYIKYQQATLEEQAAKIDVLLKEEETRDNWNLLVFAAGGGAGALLTTVLILLCY